MKRLAVILFTVGALCGFVVPSAFAACTGDTTSSYRFCDGTIVDAGDGAVINGDGTIESEASITAGNIGIWVNGNGAVYSQGPISAPSADGIRVELDGYVENISSVTAGENGIYLGNGDVYNEGAIIAGWAGIYVDGYGFVENYGDIDAVGNGIDIGSGEIYNEALIESGAQGIYIDDSGLVYNLGTIKAGYDGIYVEYLGLVLNEGTIEALNNGIDIGAGIVASTGTIKAENTGIYIYSDGLVFADGLIEAGYAGIQVDGFGLIEIVGTVKGGFAGVLGGMGDQYLEVYGTVEATGIIPGDAMQHIPFIPFAINLGEGEDEAHFHSGSRIIGDVQMGEGDDTVLLGDDSVVTGMILGGEGSEVLGDHLIIGDGMYCAEDGGDVALVNLDELDPNGGSVVYRGQSYTWAEFERISSGVSFQRCFGMINDGRINAYDLGAPDALYCIAGGGVSVWEIDLEGNGTYSFYITQEQIDAAFVQALASGVNMLIASDTFGNSFYALSDGHTVSFVAPELREPGKDYVFTFEQGRCRV